ncbi:hypothetical protein TCDM_13058 [Trypanosoma cruzi Dm28c]|uniref:Uncharacterized protein n=1 Tax=Trypanosoma cruzi Dm28c TaxID=1416333 RepID=V5CJB9_TRYCR|nr:hypothetical protein TCDM_13058 [Trypanosoma cruzi Dm28c]
MPITVDGWRCSLLYFFVGIFFLYIFPFSITYEEGKQAPNATVKSEGSERTNNTHTHTHTHIFVCSHVLLL